MNASLEKESIKKQEKNLSYSNYNKGGEIKNSIFKRKNYRFYSFL